ncbi:hypothetical protein HK096_002164 [Nowakowskiella sp. JEL0078]|nr:hypothetical protein HK096_002164 [Nowakowskiella sp. JEL0078]
MQRYAFSAWKVFVKERKEKRLLEIEALAWRHEWGLRLVVEKWTEFAKMQKEERAIWSTQDSEKVEKFAKLWLWKTRKAKSCNFNTSIIDVVTNQSLRKFTASILSNTSFQPGLIKTSPLCSNRISPRIPKFLISDIPSNLRVNLPQNLETVQPGESVIKQNNENIATENYLQHKVEINTTFSGMAENPSNIFQKEILKLSTTHHILESNSQNKEKIQKEKFDRVQFEEKLTNFRKLHAGYQADLEILKSTKANDINLDIVKERVRLFEDTKDIMIAEVTKGLKKMRELIFELGNK